MTPFRTSVFAAAILVVAGASASAQTDPAPRTNLDAKPGTLSDKLGATNGVIKPTGDVDPDMHKPAPQTGTMPVIKPKTVTPDTAK